MRSGVSKILQRGSQREVGKLSDTLIYQDEAQCP